MTKKSKVVHTRFSEEIYDKFLGLAKKHGKTVSNLLRDVTEDFLYIGHEFGTFVDSKVKKKFLTKR